MLPVEIMEQTIRRSQEGVYGIRWKGNSALGCRRYWCTRLIAVDIGGSARQLSSGKRRGESTARGLESVR